MPGKAPTFQVTVNDASETKIINNDPPAAKEAAPAAAKPVPAPEKGGK